MAGQQENRTPIVVGTVIALLILSLIAIGARLLGRFVGNTKLWWDDWLIMLAAVRILPEHIKEAKDVDTGRRSSLSRLSPQTCSRRTLVLANIWKSWYKNTQVTLQNFSR